jgi:cyclopropane-fatty-acyl-phospholipid synthase
MNTKRAWRRPPSSASVARRILGGVADGRLLRLPVAVRFWDGSELPSGGSAVVVIKDPTAIAHLVHAPGELGLARAWVDGSLEIDGELEAVLGVRDAVKGFEPSAADRARLALAALCVAGARGLRRPAIPAIESRVSGTPRSLVRDRQAIRHHYDLSNRFYRLVLGPTMVYSCAYFSDPADTLEAAQERKLDLICRKLQLTPGDRLLDVGCGWGSLPIHAATNYGVTAVGVTLSESQAQLARERVAQLGLEERIEIRVQDYREITDGPFDKICSVGMYEHVGRAELGRYVQTVVHLLRRGGLFLNHGITKLIPPTPRGSPFISRYVFPDGELHPVGDVINAMQAAGFEIRDAESLREHYPLTLRRWIANLAASRDEAVREVGHQRERVWQLYMLAGILFFESADISVYQVLAARPGGNYGLPLDRAELLNGKRQPSRRPPIA